MAVSVFKEDKRICDFLGQPIKVKRLKLGNKENRISEEDAEVRLDYPIMFFGRNKKSLIVVFGTNYCCITEYY